MHEHPCDLIFRQVQAVFPDVPVLKVAVFLNLDVVGNGRKVALEAASHSQNCEGQLVRGRHFRGIVDRVGQQTRLLRLVLLVDTQKRMPEHGGRIVQERRGEDERDGLRVHLGKPGPEPLAGLRRQTAIVEGQFRFQPMVACHERALRGLA